MSEIAIQTDSNMPQTDVELIQILSSENTRKMNEYHSYKWWKALFTLCKKYKIWPFKSDPKPSTNGNATYFTLTVAEIDFKPYTNITFKLRSTYISYLDKFTIGRSFIGEYSKEGSEVNRSLKCGLTRSMQTDEGAKAFDMLLEICEFMKVYVETLRGVENPLYKGYPELAVVPKLKKGTLSYGVQHEYGSGHKTKPCETLEEPIIWPAFNYNKVVTKKSATGDTIKYDYSTKLYNADKTTIDHASKRRIPTPIIVNSIDELPHILTEGSIATIAFKWDQIVASAGYITLKPKFDQINISTNHVVNTNIFAQPLGEDDLDLAYKALIRSNNVETQTQTMDYGGFSMVPVHTSMPVHTVCTSSMGINPRDLNVDSCDEEC